MQNKGGYVYIVSSSNKEALYTGVTSDLKGRILKHKKKVFRTSFSAKYNCHHLAYYKRYPLIVEAISEEKRIKAGNRMQKIKLIHSINPEWKDLWDEVRHW